MVSGPLREVVRSQVLKGILLYALQRYFVYLYLKQAKQRQTRRREQADSSWQGV